MEETIYYVRNKSGKLIEIARRTSTEVWFTNEPYAEFYEDSTPVLTKDQLPRGIFNIKNIREQLAVIEDETLSDAEYAEKYYVGKTEIKQRKSVFSTLQTIWHKEHDFIEVTEWTNGEGYDVVISSDSGVKQFGFHESEFAVLSYLINRLKNE